MAKYPWPKRSDYERALRAVEAMPDDLTANQVVERLPEEEYEVVNDVLNELHGAFFSRGEPFTFTGDISQVLEHDYGVDTFGLAMERIVARDLKRTLKELTQVATEEGRG